MTRRFPISCLLACLAACTAAESPYDIPVADMGIPVPDGSPPGDSPGHTDGASEGDVEPPPLPDAALDPGPLDSGPPDLGPPDLGPPDLGPPDLGPPDLGPPDLGPPDLGPLDLGPPDLGPPDLGPPDLGPLDLGPPDLGPPDAGVDASTDAGADAGRRCSSLYLDGTGASYVTVPDADVLDLTTPSYTIEAWVYPERLGWLACPYAGAENAIVYKRGSAPQGGYLVSHGNCGARGLSFDSDNGVTVVHAPGSPTTGVWHHVAVTVSAGTATIWLDGVQVGTGAVGPTVPTAYALTFGRDTPGGAAVYPWQGYIRDVRLSNVARYGSTFTPSVSYGADASTVGFWPVDEGSGTTVSDLSGHGNVGTVSGSPVWRSVCPG